VIEEEAERVRTIFRRYLELGSLNRLMAQLRKQGLVTKVRSLKTGRTVGGIPFTRGPLAHFLRNRFYMEAELRRLIAVSVPRHSQIKIDVRRLLLAEPLVPQPGTDRIATAIQRHARDILGVDVPVTGVPLYTDARHYAAAGIPVVLYGAGPRSILEANAHNANENLRLDDLRAATKIVALAVADLCRGG